MVRRKSSGTFEEAARSGNRNRLVHNPFTNSQVLVEPAVEFLVVAGDLFSLKSQAGRALHASEEGREENGIKGIVRQPSDHHDGRLILLIGKDWN